MFRTDERPNIIDMSLNDMSFEPIRQSESPFHIYPVTLLQRGDRGVSEVNLRLEVAAGSDEWRMPVEPCAAPGSIGTDTRSTSSDPANGSPSRRSPK